jgi:hypothetical protein
MILLTSGERTALFCLTVILAVIGWGALAYFLITLCCSYRPWLFAAMWGCLMGSIIGAVLLMLERQRSIDDLVRRDIQAQEKQRTAAKYPWQDNSDLTDMPTMTQWQATTRIEVTRDNSTYIADLEIAHGGKDTVKRKLQTAAFWEHVKAGKTISNRDCEPLFGGNRGAYTRCRNVLALYGVIEKTPAGSWRLVLPLPR